MSTTVTRVAIAVTAIALVLFAAGSVSAAAQGTIGAQSFRSATLGEDISYNVYLPTGYAGSTARYPVLYLLHGRGDSMSAWTRVKGELDALIAAGDIPPLIAIMPDAPWSSRASYYVDSEYKGADPGRKVETAFIRDLIPHVDATYRTMASRIGRGIGGYSMGGYGALRYSIAYPEVFGASIVLSPAVYVPVPPDDSSTREFGAFGQGNALFVESIYKKLNYPAILPGFTQKALSSHTYIAVGDDEFKNPKPADAIHDLDFEAHVLFNQIVRVPNITSELRVIDGGHDWDVWTPTFVEGVKDIFTYIGTPPATPMTARLTGTAGEERAGGVAIDAGGNVYEALAAVGPINGQPYVGDKDLVLIKRSPTGATLWTRELGSARLERAYGVALDPSGDPIVTGYTNGDLDGAHAGNTTDDAFVVKFDAAGNRLWLVQLGVPAVADRGYAIDIDAAGATYIAGYTRGNFAGTNQGDKDVIVAKLDAAGVTLWSRQFGSAGEDKAWGVSAEGTAVAVAGMTSGALGTPAGSTDGFLARYTPAGTQSWLQQFGTAGVEEVWGLTSDAAGNAYVAGYSGGDFSGTLAGDKDIIVARFDSTGAITWKDQFGTALNDKGAAIGRDATGNLYVAGFTDGRLVAPLGKFDAVLARYDAAGTRTWTRQFGTTDDDGADAFAEFNLYLAVGGNAIAVSGLTLGSTATQTQAGLGDAFLAMFDPAGTNT